MSVSSQKSSSIKEEITPNSANATSADPVPNCDIAEAAALNGDQTNKPAVQQESLNKITTKKVKIVDPGPAHEIESDDDDSLSQPGVLDRTGSTVVGEATTTSASGQPTDPQATAAAAERKKTKEERKKEREKKKEEEMLKKYQAEQEAKQRVSAKSKCGRWIKHNLKIGEGGYKFVYRGYDTVEARNVAWCEFKREHVDTKEKRQQMFKETEIMLKMNHPHIVRCFDVFREWIDMEDPNNQIEEKGVVIIQELMGEGTLKSVIRKNFLEGQCILKFPLITRWWHQILDALRYMHHKIQPPILHRDLKADNCFLYGASDEEYLNVKVGDFGLATHVNNSGRKTMLGTLGFMAPEIFDEKYDEKVDIYAFGMLMLEVMTNRTPYDECETVMQVAAKTMSGQGPDIMDKVLNPSLREVIGACIQPLTCFRPTAEELYFHPLFQPKTLPVEVEPNYDNATDRAEVLDRFVRSLDNAETRNPNFNLRLRFRDKKMLQELGLDDGESLEFDLDIYKAEDQDIPDLIHNLRLGYEDKLWRVFENPKQPDKKIVSSHLDKLFNSIRLQMQFLVKVLLGKRWKAILDSLVDELRNPRKKEGQSALDEDDDSDTDSRETSSFTIIGKYKGKWSRAKRLLDREIQAYRNATSGHLTSNPTVPTPSVNAAGAGPKTVPLPAGTSTIPTTLQADATVSGGTLTPGAHPAVHPSSTPVPTSNVQTAAPDILEANAVPSNVATIGKFSISTPPSASGAPPGGSQSATPTQSTQTPHERVQTPPVAEHVGFQPHQSNGASTHQPTVQGSMPTLLHNPQPQSPDTGFVSARLHPDSNVAQPPIMQTPLSLNPTTGLPVSNNQLHQPIGVQSQASNLPSLISSTSNVPGKAPIKPDMEQTVPANMDSVTRSALLLQQALQGIAVPPLKPFPDGTAVQPGTGTPIYNSSVVHPSHLLNQLQQQQPSLQQQQLLLAAATAAVESAIPQATSGTGSSPGHYLTPDVLMQNLTAGLLGPTASELQQAQQPFGQTAAQGSSSSVIAGQSAIPIADQQALHAGTIRGQPPVPGTVDVSQPEANAAGVFEPNRQEAGQASALLNQLTEALLGVTAGTAGSTPSGLGLQPTQQQALLQSLINQQSGQQQQLAQLNSAMSSKQSERKLRKKPKSKPRFILRITKIEKDSEGTEPGSLRPTFYLEMPDLNNPNSEVWKFSFRCNLSDTPDDIKLFKGSGYTPANEEVERAAKEAVVQMLDSLRTDVNSIKLNQDYIFYPRPHSSTAVPNVPSVAPSESSITSAHLGMGLPVTGKSSQTSLSIPSLGSRSLASQPLGSIPQPSTMVASSPNPPLPGSSLLYDSSAAMANLEEVPPIENSSHLNGLFVQHSLDGASHGRPQSFMSSNFLTGLPSSTETGHDDDDELSEISRPLSPSDLALQQQLQHFATRQLLAPNIDSAVPSTLSAGSAATSYFTASSCGSTGPSVPHHGMPSTVAQLETSDSDAPRQPVPLFGINYLSELLSLAAKKIDQLTSATGGPQANLVEVNPLAPMGSTPSSATCLPLTEVDSLTDPRATDPTGSHRREVPSLSPFDTNASLLSQLNRALTIGQSRISNTGPPEPDSFVTLTCTIPASLEVVMREVTHCLCSAPSKPYLLLPSEGSIAEDGSQQISVRLLEIPQNHVFLGVPTSNDHTSPFSLTTFKTSGEPAFIVLDGTHGEGSKVSVPRIYRTPVDSAVVLTPNGTVHCLNQACSIIPSQASEVHQRLSPQYSPSADTSDTAQVEHSSASAGQPRELPINTSVDGMTLDDLLNLLLALRSTSQQQRSTTTSPTTETFPGVNPLTNTEGHPLPSVTSRRSSNVGLIQNVHPAHLPHPLNLSKPMTPNPQLAQLQQLSLGRQQRIVPTLQQQQLSQTVSTGKTSYVDQSSIQSSQPGSGRVSVIPGAAHDVGGGSAFTSQLPTLSKERVVTGSCMAQHFPQAAILPQQSSVTSQSRWVTHERGPAHSAASAGTTVTPHAPQQSAPAEISATGLQQALQLLSALNITGSPEQLSNILVQLLRNPNLMQSVVGAQPGAPVATSLKTSASNLGVRSSFPSQPSTQWMSAMSPPVSAPGISATSSLNTSNLPAILNRLLASTVGSTERIAPTETGNVVPSQVAPGISRPTMPTPTPAVGISVSVADSPGLNHVPASGFPGTVAAHLQASGQQSLPYAVSQQMRPSQLIIHPEGSHSQQVSIGQSNVHQKVPDLGNMLRILHSQPDATAARELLATLPVETQSRLLSALQPQTTRTTSFASAPGPQSTQSNQPAPASSVTTQPVVPKPTSCAPPSCCPPTGTTSTNLPPLTAPSSIPLPRNVNTVPSLTDVTQSSTVNPPLSAAPTTVANKFTVVSVRCENDEPAPPVQPAASITPQPGTAGSQWNQAPPRPPRQRTVQPAPVPPPPPPATPNCQLGTDPMVFSSLPTGVGASSATPGLTSVGSSTSGPSGSVKQLSQIYKDEPRIAVASTAINVPVKNLPSISSRGTTSAQPPSGPAVPVQQLPTPCTHITQSSLVTTTSTANPTISSNASTGLGP